MLLQLMAAVGQENGVHIAADPKEVMWASAAFIVLMIPIVVKGGPAITRVMNQRTERIRNELAGAADARAQAEAALADSKADLPDVASEEARLREEAVQTADRLKADLVAKAHADAAALVERANTDAEVAKRQALADLTDEVARLTRGAAEAVVTESLDANAQDALIEQYITQVGQLSSR